MAKVEDIKWGRYGLYEGPFYRGTQLFDFSSPDSLEERTLAVITATEGGAYDAINMYDGQIISSGLIQFIERGQRSVSAMLGSLLPYAVRPVTDRLKEMTKELRHEYVFQPDSTSRWFFYVSGNRVDTLHEQRHVWHLNSTGHRGTWDDASKLHAKKWAAAVASVWEDPKAQRTQREFTLRMLKCFLFGNIKKYVAAADNVGTDEAMAFRAMLMSFAINNPARANKHIQIAADSYKGAWWSKDFLIHCARELTFGPRIAIYPHRWEAIRPKLEMYFNLDLPDYEEDLREWKKDTGHETFFTTKQVQEALIGLGFDLGPWGADGVYGPKTRQAVLTFEQLHEVPNPDGMMDPLTGQFLLQEVTARGLDTPLGMFDV